MGAKKKASTKPKTGKTLVIVESPAKARTISKFLGSDYAVQASIGHVRDLPQKASELPEGAPKSKDGPIGVDIEGGYEAIYIVPADKKKQITELRKLLKNAPELLLATDEDREGESISWHLLEVLKPKVPVKRLVFHEITRGAIARALQSARDVDMHLVEAQESRRILDRLFGYPVSGLLWRKIGRQRLSAGRVQSVALRLLVEREQERIAFVPAEYWDITAEIAAERDGGARFQAELRELDGKRVASGRHFDPATGKLTKEDVRLVDGATAKRLAEALKGGEGTVLKVEEKPYTQRPAAPFTTSTLQQEAGRKLRYPAQRTMRLAQRLYENGAITYMRTDSTILSSQAIDAARSLIDTQYGGEYLPAAPRSYKTKVKNAQEAHEAIRPAGSRFRSIDEVKTEFGSEAGRLYEMIWKRTVASQMKDATGRRMTVRIGLGDAVFRAGGRTVDFAGFRRAYVEGSDDPEAELAEQERILPPLAVGQTVWPQSLDAKEHWTQPPARFTEASLVKELDKRGIGRPSTWAAIIGKLLDRQYTFKRGTALIPAYLGFAVVRLLEQAFGEVVDYEFTARMEDDLDQIASGKLRRAEYLRRFWEGNGKPGLHRSLADALESVNPREVCGFPVKGSTDASLEIRVGRYGLFVTDGEHRASLKEDIVPDEFSMEAAAEAIEAAARGPRTLGADPDSGMAVYITTGRYGPYVQLGEQEEGGEKPKRESLLKGMEPESLTLEIALKLLSLPRELGSFPEGEGAEPIIARNGRYGPFVKCGKESRSIPAEINLLEITHTQAVELLKQPRRRGRTAQATLREIGKHPDSEALVVLKSGRYGPYVTDGEVNASVPKGKESDDLTLEEAVDLLERRRERLAAGGGARKRPKKKAARKKKAKKKTAKKKAKKKTAKKKASKSAAKKKTAKKPPASGPDAA